MAFTVPCAAIAWVAGMAVGMRLRAWVLLPIAGAIVLLPSAVIPAAFAARGLALLMLEGGFFAGACLGGGLPRTFRSAERSGPSP